MSALVYTMTVSVDGYVTDRQGGLDWAAPEEELFAFHLARVRELGGYLLGRRLHDAMRVWETDASLAATPAGAAFAAAWTRLPRTVFSRSEAPVAGAARRARGPLADEVRHALRVADGKDVAIGGAQLAAAAVALDLVDEYRVFRYPVVLGGGTPYLPSTAALLPLRLVDTRTVGTRVVLERYHRVRDEAPSSVSQHR